MKLRTLKTLVTALSLGLLSITPVLSQVREHRWLAVPPWHDPKAFFTNLENNQKVVSPFVVQFGMSNWGIAPAKHKHVKTGHHHLLVDAALPIPIDKPIPFSKNYVHFGAGQMQTVLDLAPGEHKLRLLLADHEHVPHMVYSQELTVVVTERSDAKALELKSKAPELSFPNIKDGDTLKPYFKVQFHAAGLNVANKATQLAGTGYFRLSITPASGNTQNLPFPSGATEAWLNLPEGNYKLVLHMLNNPTDVLNPVQSQPVLISVRK